MGLVLLFLLFGFAQIMFSLFFPVAARLELRGSKYVLGEFMEFKGKQEDLQTLQYIKRSKVSQMIVQKTSMFGLGDFSAFIALSFIQCSSSHVEF